MAVAQLARATLRLRWIRIWALLFALTAVVLGFLPLLQTIGWEYATGFALPLSIVGGCLGASVVRISRERGTAGPEEAPFRCFVAALPALALFVLPPIAIGYAHGLHTRNCAPALSAEFWLLIPASSALFSLALGISLARPLASPRRAGWVLVALVLVSGAASALGALHGPAIFFGNHFLGWFDGPIYDQVITVPSGLIYLRLLSFLLALLFLLLAGIAPDATLSPSAMRRPDPRALFELLLVAVAFAVAFGFRKDFRLDLTARDIQTGLGGHVTTPHFEIWYSKDAVDPSRLKLLVEDHEMRFDQVTRYLGIVPRRRLHSYVFPNEGAKKYWTGAGGTQVANPWLGEIYLNDDGHPLPVLPHEMTHAISGDFGIPFFGYSMDFHPLEADGMIEGIAVAADFHDNGQGNPDEQSAAMLKDGLLPRPEKFLSLPGFRGDRGPRAYVASGSFVHFLVARYGADKFRAVYPWCRFRAVYGKDLSALGEEWVGYLETIPVPPSRQAAAKERFTAPSLFERTCARELSLLEQRGWEAMGHEHWGEAHSLFERWRTVDDRPEPLRALLALARQSGDDSIAQTLAGQLLEREVPQSPHWWNAKLTLADLAWERGELLPAAEGYRGIVEAHPSSDLARTAWVKGEAVELERHGAPEAVHLAHQIQAWLGPRPRERDVVALVEAALEERERPFVGVYLIAKYQMNLGRSSAALPWTERAISTMPQDVDRSVRAEAWSMRAEALTRVGRLADARSAWSSLREVPGLPGDLVDRANDGLARVSWLDLHPAIDVQESRP